MRATNTTSLDLYVRPPNTERAALALTMDAGAAEEATELLRGAGFSAEPEV